ncbi:MAG: class I SAM-dependent methyltransferase [Candidatus Latescibacteria bacterium]|nr:class I SAM-dependent methyltransferase [Candidatus Latescibacterota bacterium]
MSKGIQNIFSEVSDTYDLVNHVLTFGLDTVWRKKAAKIAAQSPGGRWLDVCTGTGETAVNLRRLASPDTKIFLPLIFCYPC